MGQALCDVTWLAVTSVARKQAQRGLRHRHTGSSRPEVRALRQAFEAGWQRALGRFSLDANNPFALSRDVCLMSGYCEAHSRGRTANTLRLWLEVRGDSPVSRHRGKWQL